MIIESVKPSANTAIGQLLKNDPNFFPTLKTGDLIEGKVLEKSSKMLTVDLGKFGTGAVYRGELQNAKELVKSLNVNDPVHAKVVNIDNEEGLVELSLSQADKQKAWTDVQELMGKEEAIKIKITGFNKGGLMAELKGLGAFLPVSQLSGEHYPKVGAEEKGKILEALQAFVGQEFEVKIIDANPRTSKLIVSERAAQELSAKELAKNYSVGQVIEGVVSGVADFGVFIRFTDNPALEGFIHVSEIDYRVIENPKEFVKIDEAVKAKITDIKDGRISLSLKALKEDPWAKVQEFVKEGDTVKGAVYLFNPFGAIVNLEHGLQGQVHVTDFGGVPEMKKEITAGQTYEFAVFEVKPQDKRIVLKLKK
jgi:small subunit ribosomal protein S1